MIGRSDDQSVAAGVSSVDMTPIDVAQPANPSNREVPPDQGDPSLTDAEAVAKALNVNPATGLSDDEAW
ncbi:MAG: hypothetical protein LKI26_00460, partial [Bifidobacterium tibiigranuli]|nr:hypothetical protein [Bifidobacterium tibiigranuli]